MFIATKNAMVRVTGHRRRERLSRRSRWRQKPLAFERLEERSLLAAADAVAEELLADSEPPISRAISTPGEVDYYWIDVSEPQQAGIDVRGSDGLDTRMQLFAVAGTPDDARKLSFDATQLVDLLAESDDHQLGSFDPRLDLHLDPGGLAASPGDPQSQTMARFYVLAVSASPTASGATTGDYTISLKLDPTALPFQRITGVERIIGDKRPESITSGYIDDDKILDLAVANSGTNDVTILLGSGDGTFRPLDPIEVGSGPTSIVSAHFNDDNGDGQLNDQDHLDLAVANAFSDEVAVLFGKGNGHFEDPERFSVGKAPEAIAAFDIDGDGAIDLAVANQKSGDVTLLRNQPHPRSGQEIPHFARLDVDLGLKTEEIQDLVVTELADHSVLLAVTGEDSDTVEIRVKGPGESQFRSPADASFDVETPYSITHADMNHDGAVDLVVVSDFPRTAITVLPGMGGGRFGPPIVTPLNDAEDTENLVTADLNRDGNPDVIVSAEARPGELLVLLGKGDGHFQPPIRTTLDGDPEGMVLAHLNGDPFLDLAVVSRATGSTSIFLGEGDGTFFRQPRNRVGRDPESIIAEDFNGDGRLDIATANIATANRAGGDDTVSVLFATGPNAYEDAINFKVGRGPRDLVAGDLDGDGRLDIVTANRFSNDVSVLWGKAVGFAERTKPDGSDEQPVRWNVDQGGGPSAVRIADVNRDGLLDLITQNDLTDDFSVFFGKGNRDFEHEELRKSLTEDVLSQLARPFPSLDATPADPSETGRFQPEVAVTADVNGDGILDLITSALLVNEVVVRLGEVTEPGHVQFGREWRFRTPLKDPRMLLARDFDDDGAMDLAIVHTKKKSVSILWGGGPKQLFNPKDRKPQVIKVGKAPTFLAAEDFDRDGDLDLVVANEGDDTVEVLFLQKGGQAAREESSNAVFRRGAPAEIADDRKSFQATHTLLNDRLAFALRNDDDEEVASLFSQLRNEAGGWIAPYVAVESVTFTPGAKGAQLAVFYGGLPAEKKFTLNASGDGWKVKDQEILADANGSGSFLVSTDKASHKKASDIGSVTIKIAEKIDGKSELLTRATIAIPEYSTTVPQLRLHSVMVDGEGTATVTGDFDGANSTFPSVTVDWWGSIDVGERPDGIVAAYLNDDNLPDLAVLNGGKGGNEGTLSILLGNGDGTFDEQRFPELLSDGSDCKPEENACRLPVGLNPVAIAAGDLTEDGFVDLVVANRLPGAVRVLEGHENGQFSKPVRVDIAEAAEARLSDLVVTDLDNDTHLDVAVSIREANGVVWLNGDGKGGFATQHFVDLVGHDSKGKDPLSIVAAELSGDPWPELITANRKSDNVSVLINVGVDNAPKQTIFGVGISSEAFFDAPIDLDGDGHPDLERRFTATRDDRVTVQERTNIGQDTFGPWITKPQGAPDRLARGPLIGDVSGDGVDDIITMNRAGEVFVRIGRGEAGGFRPPQILAGAAGAQDVALVTAGPTDRAGARMRLAVLDRGSATASTLHVYSLQVEGNLVTGPDEETSIQLDVGRSRITATDLDRDGDDDLVLLNLDEGTVAIRWQDAAGNFEEGSKIDVDQGPWEVDVVPDTRGGRLPMLVLTNRLSGDISRLAPAGGRAYRQQQLLRGSNVVYDVFPVADDNAKALRDATAGLTLADVNTDGHPDLVTTSAAFSTASVLYAKGPVGFFDPQPLKVNLPSPATDVIAGDLDGDRVAELLFLHPGQQRISIWRRVDDGLYEPAGALDAGNAPVSLSLTHPDPPDESGVVDLLVGNQFGDVLIWEVGADGSFQKEGFTRIDRTVSVASFGSGAVVARRSQDEISRVLDDGTGGIDRVPGDSGPEIVQAPEMVRLIDVNGDGIDDLVVANSGNIEQDDVLVYLAESEGSYAETPIGFSSGTDRRAGVLATPIAVTGARLNADDLPDLVVTNFGSNSVAVLLSDPRGTSLAYREPTLVELGPNNPVSTEVRDVTGDGVVDLLVTTSTDGSVQLWPGDRVEDATGFRVVFREVGPVLHLGGPTSEQGTVYSGNEGFVAMADGSVVRFTIDALLHADESTGGERLRVQPVDAAARITDVVAVQAMDVNADGRSDLFVTGFDAQQQPALALLVASPSDVFREMPIATPATLIDPADLAARQLGGVVELLVGQDSPTTPVIRLLTVTANPGFVNGSAGLVPVSADVGGLGDSRSFTQLPNPTSDEIGPQRFGEAAEGSDDSFVGLLEIITRNLERLADAFLTAVEHLYHAFGTTLRSFVPPAGDGLYAELVDEVFGRDGPGWLAALSSIPPSGIMLDVAHSTLGLGQVVATWPDGFPENADSDTMPDSDRMEPRPDDIAWLVERVRDSLKELLGDPRKEEITKLADLVGAAAPGATSPSSAEAMARLQAEIRHIIGDLSEQLQSVIGSGNVVRVDEADQVDSLSRIVTIGLLYAGTAGMTWHTVDKFRAQRGTVEG